MALCGALPLAAQAGGRLNGLAAGRLLVASRNLPDPNFAETAVLLVHYDEKGAMGLVINRPTGIPLSRLLRELKEAKGRPDEVYAGGPVGRTGVLALLRSSTKPEEARHVFADVYLISTKTLLEKALAAGTNPHALRVYLGYAGWTAGQLEREVELGTWHILRGEAGLVFDPDPGSVWTRLIRRTNLQIVRRRNGMSSETAVTLSYGSEH
jgi:putative transcriptional regulator